MQSDNPHDVAKHQAGLARAKKLGDEIGKLLGEHWLALLDVERRLLASGYHKEAAADVLVAVRSIDKAIEKITAFSK